MLATLYQITHEFYDLGHLHLGKDTVRRIFTELRGISDGEGVWALDCDLAGLAVVEFFRPFNLCEGDKIAIF